MSFQRGIDSGDPQRPQPVAGEQELRIARNRRLGVGTMACPECDAPVALPGPVAPADRLAFEFNALFYGYNFAKRLLRDPDAESRVRTGFERLLAAARA